MKFRLYVDPPSAMRAGNERILEQFVDVDLSELSDAQREIVADSYLSGSPSWVDLRRMPNGGPVPEVGDLKIAVADRAAVISIIQTRLDAIAEETRLKAFADEHFKAAIGGLIARYKPVFQAFRGDRREEELIARWVEETYGEDMTALLEQRVPEEIASLGSQDERFIDRIVELVDITIGMCDGFESHRVGGGLVLDAMDLPNDEAGVAYLSRVARQMMKEEGRRAWVSEQWAKRRVALEAVFMASLNSKREAVDSLLEAARKQREGDDENKQTVMRIVTVADAKQPDQGILERYKQGVLPSDELMALLRDVAFEPLHGFPRFKRIADSEVKRKRAQEVSYEVVENYAIKAKHFQLAKNLKGKMPAAKIKQVTHRALVDGEAKVARDAVRVTVDFAGHRLSREYVPADK